jgi:hypothetical protein
MEEKDDKTPFLEMRGGLHNIDYPAKYMHAPQSCHPPKGPSNGKTVNQALVMRMSLGR